MKNKTKKKSRIPIFIITVSAVIVCFSIYMIISVLIKGAQEQNAFDELTAFVEQQKEQADYKDDQTEQITIPEVTEMTAIVDVEPVILSEYAALYEQNNDLFGWLRIDNTNINYPVMHTPDDSQYYLHRAFDRSDSRSGTPFLDGACFEGCLNYIIYGHRMNNGTMFGMLSEYADKDFWEQHKTICFDTIYEYGEYEIIAVFYETANVNSTIFNYCQYTDLTNPSIFEEYIEQVEAVALYDTGITAEYGDEILTLSTCSYHTANGRFVVVARKNNGAAKPG